MRDEGKKQNKTKKVDFTLIEKGSTNYILNVKGECFSFVEIFGDGNCFYHSVLKKKSSCVRKV